MLKTISAALLAASVLAAPALAATSGKSTQPPVTQTPVTKTMGTATNGAAKPDVQTTKAKFSKRHIAHVGHYKHHRKVGAMKSKSKISLKPTAATSKRS